uniref:Integrase catalytic domain-containing protein n=1 Tax=Astyanax mexicanus TaxID=7994 RepID=A0A3B1KG74_ASTMX
MAMLTFSIQGLPEMIVSDNGACFMSAEFKEFMIKNGITHVTSAPFHASSNGLAERAVQTFKTMMKKAGEGSISTKVARVLFSYRITPQSTTGKSPAEMLQGRQLRSTLDLVHPDLKRRVIEKQDKQKKSHDKQCQGREFEQGVVVMTRNFSHGPKWIRGLIEEVTGPVSYKVRLGDGKIVRRHVDQILAGTKDFVKDSEIPHPQGPSVSASVSTHDSQSAETTLRRSQRTVRKPTHLQDYEQ